MSLLNHFDQSVDDAQHTFRRILKALSEPGVVVSLPHRSGWQPLNPATTSILLTLVDQETSLYLDEPFNNDAVQQNIRFHCGAPLTTSVKNSLFSLFDNGIKEEVLMSCPVGNELSPEYSTTVILQATSLHLGVPLRLRGPGIEHHRTVAPQLPSTVLNYLLNRPIAFPAGLDFLLTCGENLMAIPRTTHVEVC